MLLLKKFQANPQSSNAILFTQKVSYFKLIRTPWAETKKEKQAGVSKRSLFRASNPRRSILTGPSVRAAVGPARRRPGLAAQRLSKTTALAHFVLLIKLSLRSKNWKCYLIWTSPCCSIKFRGGGGGAVTKALRRQRRRRFCCRNQTCWKAACYCITSLVRVSFRTLFRRDTLSSGTLVLSFGYPLRSSITRNRNDASSYIYVYVHRSAVRISESAKRRIPSERFRKKDVLRHDKHNSLRIRQLLQQSRLRCRFLIDTIKLISEASCT